MLPENIRTLTSPSSRGTPCHDGGLSHGGSQKLGSLGTFPLLGHLARRLDEGSLSPGIQPPSPHCSPHKCLSLMLAGTWNFYSFNGVFFLPPNTGFKRECVCVENKTSIDYSFIRAGTFCAWAAALRPKGVWKMFFSVLAPHPPQGGCDENSMQGAGGPDSAHVY